MTPEANARKTIDALLVQAGWHVCAMHDANIHAARGVALREFPLNTGFGFADYLLYIDGKPRFSRLSKSWSWQISFRSRARRYATPEEVGEVG